MERLNISKNERTNNFLNAIIPKSLREAGLIGFWILTTFVLLYLYYKWLGGC